MAYYILKSYKLKVAPFKIFANLNTQSNCFFLDSSLNSSYSLGRYSFLGIEPFYVLESKNADLFLRLRHTLNKFKLSLPKSNLPFLGGAVGYLAYDADLGIPKSYFGFYNTIIIIDHLKQRLYISSIGFPERNYFTQSSLCKENFKKVYNLLSGADAYQIRNKGGHPKFKAAELKSNFTKEDYILAIKKAKQYIKNGDIYQVNLSQRFQAKTSLSSFKIYGRLRQVSPSYFSAYLDCGSFQILSSSPERFLKVKGDVVTTRPMKGTRPRSKNRIKDTAFKKELLNSQKDKAELMMIVDLERNDLGRVCNYNSIKVNPLRELEEYSTVFQTTATVQGRLHRDKDRIDLLRACSPGGSITGCPKIRAMEIIKELEPTRRSIYTGSLGYLSFTGGMDFNILIRTILKKEDKIYFGVGGGIVADSNPQDEYQETLIKARGMMRAVGWQRLFS